MKDIINYLEMRKQKNIDMIAFVPTHLEIKFKEDNELIDKLIKMIKDAIE